MIRLFQLLRWIVRRSVLPPEIEPPPVKSCDRCGRKVWAVVDSGRGVQFLCLEHTAIAFKISAKVDIHDENH